MVLLTSNSSWVTCDLFCQSLVMVALQGFAALHIAASHGHVDTAAELLKAEGVALDLQQTEVSRHQSMDCHSFICFSIALQTSACDWALCS